MGRRPPGKTFRKSPKRSCATQKASVITTSKLNWRNARSFAPCGRPLEQGKWGVSMTTNYIGRPISRVDGRAKVTGAAKYAAEYNVPNLAYGCVVSSSIAKGRIINIDASDALRLEG